MNTANTRRFALVAMLILVCSGLAAEPRGTAPLVRQFDRIAALESPSKSNRQTIELRAGRRTWTLQLEDHAALIGRLPSQARAGLARGGARFLRGNVEGLENSWARLNWIDGRWSGAVFDGNELWLIDRADRLGLEQRSRASDAVLFRMADLAIEQFIDHGGITVPGAQPPPARRKAAPATDYRTFASHLREIVALQGTAMMALPITIVTDTHFTEDFPGNELAITLGRINFIDGIYSDQVGVGITLWHHEPLKSANVMTASDANQLLSEFGEFMNGAGSEIPFSGLAHLFTGRPRDGSTAGIAYLFPDQTATVICRRLDGMGVVWTLASETTSSLVFAHEVGHNFNARHDDVTDPKDPAACPEGTFRGIMNSFLRQDTPQQFSQCSLNAMLPTLAGVSCLVNIEDLFADGFETTP
ncbi:MAG: M12 family metallo-peptidase [Wenzhouxiangellaceae bacterium]|nr:M12 family metallo-peptidase [Wenzhouxiangellaceae bacterium]